MSCRRGPGLGVNVYTYTKIPGQNFYNLNVTNGWGGPAFPGQFISTTPELSEDFDWIRGAHSLSFGGMWVRPYLDADGPFQANGNFAFNGTRTGGATAQDRLGIADFLVGSGELVQPGRKPDRLGEDALRRRLHTGRLAHERQLHVQRRPAVGAVPGGEDQHGYTMAFKLDRFMANQRSKVFPNAPAV
jgi:hypothetical protein